LDVQVEQNIIESMHQYQQGKVYVWLVKWILSWYYFQF